MSCRFALSAWPVPTAIAARTFSWAITSPTLALSGKPACARQAAMFGNTKKAHFVAIVAGHDDIQRQRRQRRNPGDGAACRR